MHNQYMKRALELSKKGIGYTNPNPLVGAVIVKDGEVIGEGYHQYCGGPHAEINAFTNAIDDVRGTTMYVTLEPCSHYGRTPPCAQAIVEKGIAKVIIGMSDPNPIVAGKGIEILKQNNIDVTVGVLEEDIRHLNEIFIKYITIGRPFCTLKTAMTLDGKIATVTGDSKWITNEKSRKYTHQLRHRMSAIMVGIGTVLTDNPLLNTRLDDTEVSHPIRIVVDSCLRTPIEAKVLDLKRGGKTIIATTEKADSEKIEALSKKGIEILLTPLKDDKVDLKYLMEELGRRKIDSILLEGGSNINYSALHEGIVDKVVSFIAPKIIGGAQAKTCVGGEGRKYMKDAIMLKNMNVQFFDDDMMLEGYISPGGMYN